MNIAVDYDNTFTVHKWFWMRFMIQCQEQGWNPVIVTMRSEELDWDEDFDQLRLQHGIPVICTDGRAKKPFLIQHGIPIDIWIDDKPEGIIADSPWGPNSPELAAWRANGRK